MDQNSTCSGYSNSYREIFQKRIVESGYEALSASALEAASNATTLSDLIEVWATVGAKCRETTAPETPEIADPVQARFMELPLRDMMKSMALERACGQWTGPPENFTPLLAKLYQTADVQEQQAIILVLPLLNSGERFIHVATEAARTNIVPVFSSLALNNPFPQEHFTENQWNQMVLKAIFVGCDITRIAGLAERHNPALSETIFQYVSERNSASRSVPRSVVELCERALSDTSQHKLNAIKSDLRQE
ncbi:MAG TPA: hypothetical protein DDW52_11410 [Planctomycetaceae bacterium]|nr:hypothetical protein [Planctomycetaceae bacterium]